MRTFRFRLTASFVVLLAVAAAIVLLFVNTAAHLAAVPVETVQYPDPVSGFIISSRVVDGAEAQARAEMLSRLRFFSVLGFVALILGGMTLSSYVAGRALQPVAQMASVARRISGRNLKERIAMEGSADDELKQLADAFDDMVERLDDAFERQSRFVADASHELRTPLTALQVTLDEVRSDPDADVADYRRLAEDAAAATTRMRRLVEDMLALAQAGRPPELQPLSLSALAEAVVDELEPLATRRSIRIASAVPAGLVALGDPTSLRRALTNLVENAVRYNHDGGHVMVEQAAAPPGHVGVAVRDDGVGIPPEALPRIFDRFYRVDTGRSRVDGGSGLVLSIVAKVAADHGGTVAVESTPGAGSRFTLTLPAPGSEPAAG